tara:strand:+ start:1008 stop:1112 length:105 start_codon:yes stop_codon:yes gene_type:complete
MDWKIFDSSLELLLGIPQLKPNMIVINNNLFMID